MLLKSMSSVRGNCFLDLLWLLLAAPGTLFKNLQPLRESLFDRVLCGHFASAGFSPAPSQLRVFDERFELFEPLPRGCRQEAVAVLFHNFSIHAYQRRH